MQDRRRYDPPFRTSGLELFKHEHAGGLRKRTGNAGKKSKHAGVPREVRSVVNKTLPQTFSQLPYTTIGYHPSGGSVREVGVRIWYKSPAPKISLILTVIHRRNPKNCTVA